MTFVGLFDHLMFLLDFLDGLVILYEAMEVALIVVHDLHLERSFIVSINICS